MIHPETDVLDDRDSDIVAYREAARSNLELATVAVDSIRSAVRSLQSKHLYDVELTEGTGPLVETVLANVMIQLKALEALLPQVDD